jgi:hypothetical protein
MNLRTKNIFQRRIMGLVSYYIGATPDLYASQVTHFVDVSMSAYQTEVYNYFEEIEYTIAKNKKKDSKSGETYRTYTRQSSNFVFPTINDIVMGETRPRPSKFKIGEKELEMILKTKDTEKIKELLSSQKHGYLNMLDLFYNTFDKYLQKIHDKESTTTTNLQADVLRFKDYDTFEEFMEKDTKKSELLNAMIVSSTKFVNIIFNVLKSQGPVLIYSNYVLMEGLSILKLYLKYFGFGHFTDPNTKPFFGYGEFFSGIAKEIRKKTLNTETDKENVFGKLVKIVLFSPAGAEGISLESIRQVHIIEPYWHEVRIIQMIGRAVRQCSHKYLPLAERHVDIYRYRSIKHNIKIKEIVEGQVVTKHTELITDPQLLKTVDFEIEHYARTKQNLLQSFLDAIKEVAIDCEIFKNHNMMGTKYKCFQFNEISLFDKNIGPAYKEDILDDLKIENGSNSTKTITIKVKAMKIKGIVNDKIDKPTNYWYNPESGVVYDFDLYYPIGKIKYSLDKIPLKIDKDTYHVDLIPIPLIKNN